MSGRRTGVVGGAALVPVLMLALVLVFVPPDPAGATPPAALPPPPDAERTADAPAPPESDIGPLLWRLQRPAATRPRGATAVAAIDGVGRTIVARNAGDGLVPASTMKVMTAAAALRLLGPGHRFTTRVVTAAAPEGDGVVRGDLVLVGGGDPALASPAFSAAVDPQRPATSLDRLADRVARAGVTAVTGRIVGDPSVLADQPIAPGWTARYLTSLNAARVSGLTVDAGRRIDRRGGRLVGSPATDPALRAARVLRDLLVDRGIDVGAPPARRVAGPGERMELARVDSPPLERLLAHTLRTSDNHLADGIVRMLGAAAGDPTWAGAARAVLATLPEVPPNGLRLADGSGLSRDNRLTAHALTTTMQAMAAGPHRERWLRLLAVAGESGTMRRRLVGTPAQGRAHAKTGTLRDVRALVATVPARNGGHRGDRHVAVVVNELGTYADVLAARRLADALTLALVTDVDACPPPGAPRAVPSDGPASLICR